MKKEIRIPIPNTRFILIARQNEDTSWNMSILDPRDGTEKSSEQRVPDPVFGLLSSIVLKTEIN